jgi:hypothetical protein
MMPSPCPPRAPKPRAQPKNVGNPRAATAPAVARRGARNLWRGIWPDPTGNLDIQLIAAAVECNPVESLNLYVR